MITHLELDILECEVKWAVESITTNKASGGDGIPVELFQIRKEDAVKVLHESIHKLKEKAKKRKGRGFGSGECLWVEWGRMERATSFGIPIQTYGEQWEKGDFR